MPETHTYTVEVLDEGGGPEPELRERLAVVAAYRLSALEQQEGSYPEAGGGFDMLDNLEGPFLWEMSDADLEASPPTSVQFEVVSVEPAERPATPSPVHVTVRVPF